MNKLNDILFVGDLHNKVLYEAGQLPGFPKITTEQVSALARKAITAYYANNELGEVTFPNQDEVNNGVRQANDNPIEEVINQLREQGRIDDEQQQLLNELVEVVKKTESPAKLESVLLDWEEKQNTALDFDRGVLVLGASIVVRSSTWFWSEAATDKANPWNPVIGSQPQAKLLKALADLAGFILGAGIGGAICGPTCGAAGGTLVGAAASSDIKE